MKHSRLLRLVLSFAVLMGAYGAYALAVVPFIEPTVAHGPSSSQGAGPIFSSQDNFLKGYSHLFEEGSWELKAKLVQLESAIVLMQDYKPLENGELQIKPCTVIYQAQGENSDGTPKRPVIMQAPEGATLRFDELDLAAANIGKIQDGVLNGEIHIWSPESEEGAGDRLDIHTYNLQLEKQRISTVHDVTFRYGESYGSGRDLSILLESNEGGSGSPLGGIRSMELVRVEQIYLVPPPSKDEQTGEPADQSPLQITCAGSFVLDLLEQVASFNEQVNVHRLHSDGPSDQLQCEELAIYFQEQAVEPAAEGAPAPQEEPTSKLQLARIVARGTPVIGRGPSFQAEVRGERLEFDFERRILDLAGEGGVWLQHGSRRIDAPRVQYQLAEEGKLGRAWAPGPGRVIVRDEETGEIQLNASWQTDVQLRPHEDMHVLSLYGDAQAGLGPAGGIAATEIHVWLREQAEPAVDPATGQPSDDIAKSGIMPDRMMADGGVTITSPQLVAHTRRVELWLEDRTPPGSEVPTPAANDPASGGFPGQPTADTPPTERLQVAGEMLRVLLIRQDAEWIVENLTLENGVELVQMPVDPAAPPMAAPPPLRVVGDFLQMRGVSQTGGTVTVRGAPAVIEARDVITRGDNIQLDRQQNRLWIEGPGQLDLPLKGDLLTQPTAPQPNVVPIGTVPTVEAPQRATVTWQGGLEFNGQVFRFSNQIEITQNPADPNEGTATRVTSQQLEVVLDQALDFAHPETDGQLQVRQVALVGNVDVRSQTVSAGQLVSRDTMQAKRLSFDPPTGRFTATGPGVVHSTRRGAAGSLLPAGTGGAAAPRPAQQEQGINYLEVTFNQGIAGNSEQRQLEFFDRVVTLYGPVDDWNQTLAVPAERAVPMDMIMLTCERLQVAQVGRTTQNPGWMELTAQGNTIVEGHNFTARGMRMSYTEEKELLVMEGDGRSSVQLWHRSDTGEESSLAARKIFFDRRTSNVQWQDVTSFGLSESASPPTR